MVGEKLPKITKFGHYIIIIIITFAQIWPNHWRLHDKLTSPQILMNFHNNFLSFNLDIEIVSVASVNGLVTGKTAECCQNIFHFIISIFGF